MRWDGKQTFWTVKTNGGTRGQDPSMGVWIPRKKHGEVLGVVRARLVVLDRLDVTGSRVGRDTVVGFLLEG